MPKKEIHNALEIWFGAWAMLQALWDKKIIVEWIDISPGMQAVAQKRNPNAKLHIWDFMNHMFHGKQFDLLMLQALIHLFPKHHVAEAILPKLHHLLSDDWIIHMTTTKADTDKEWMFAKNDYEWVALDRFRSHYTQSTFEDLMSDKNGFELLDVTIEQDALSDKKRMWITWRKIT